MRPAAKSEAQPQRSSHGEWERTYVSAVYVISLVATVVLTLQSGSAHNTQHLRTALVIVWLVCVALSILPAVRTVRVWPTVSLMGLGSVAAYWRWRAALSAQDVSLDTVVWFWVAASGIALLALYMGLREVWPRPFTFLLSWDRVTREVAPCLGFIPIALFMLRI